MLLRLSALEKYALLTDYIHSGPFIPARSPPRGDEPGEDHCLGDGTRNEDHYGRSRTRDLHELPVHSWTLSRSDFNKILCIVLH